MALANKPRPLPRGERSMSEPGNGALGEEQTFSLWTSSKLSSFIASSRRASRSPGTVGGILYNDFPIKTQEATRTARDTAPNTMIAKTTRGTGSSSTVVVVVVEVVVTVVVVVVVQVVVNDVVVVDVVCVLVDDVVVSVDEVHVIVEVEVVFVCVLVVVRVVVPVVVVTVAVVVVRVLVIVAVVVWVAVDVVEVAFPAAHIRASARPVASFGDTGRGGVVLRARSCTPSCGPPPTTGLVLVVLATFICLPMSRISTSESFSSRFTSNILKAAGACASEMGNTWVLDA